MHPFFLGELLIGLSEHQRKLPHPQGCISFRCFAHPACQAGEVQPVVTVLFKQPKCLLFLLIFQMGYRFLNSGQDALLSGTLLRKSAQKCHQSILHRRK